MLQSSLEIFSTVDLASDVFVIVQLAQSAHIAWFTLNIQSVLWPFLICYTPFIAFKMSKLNKIEQEKNSCVSVPKKIAIFFSVTPVLLIYLFIIDLSFLLVGVVSIPVILLVTLLTCGNYGEAEMNRAQNWLFKGLFGMTRMDAQGFRRLRTLSQLTFESITQILLQCWILYKLSLIEDEEEMEAIGISVSALLFSIITALIHAVLEIIMLIIEKRAYRTSLIHYASVCLTGTFGWVPFTHLLRDIETA